MIIKYNTDFSKTEEKLLVKRRMCATVSHIVLEPQTDAYFRI